MTSSRRPSFLCGVGCVLLFLLALSLFPAQSRAGVIRSLSVEEEELEQHLPATKREKNHQWFKKNYKKIGDLARIIPVLGPFVKTALDLIPEEDKMNTIKFEVNALSARLDIFNEELKWASSEFQFVMGNIANAWLKYSQLLPNDKALENIFVPFYSQFVDSTLVLYDLLKYNKERGTASLSDALAKKLRCHEKDVEAQFLYLNKLVARGNAMDEKFYQLKGVDPKDRKKISTKIATESALALYESHQKCLSNSPLYVKRDVLERIDDDLVHKVIADNIGDFLKNTYGRFDWLVVAFTTHNSEKTGRGWKNHIITGFTKIQRGSVTVAVAEQVKGSFTHVDVIKTAIDKCLRNIEQCHFMDKVIEKCTDEKVLNQNLADLITAIHTFPKKLLETTLKSYTSEPEHVYTGECKDKTGGDYKYDILIKSDEEIALDNPCDKLKCEPNGECQVVPPYLIAMCECSYPFYGEKCEKNYEDIVYVNYWFPKMGVELPVAVKP